MNDEKLTPMPTVNPYSVWFYCDYCRACVSAGVRMRHKTDGRDVKLCAECARSIGIVRHETTVTGNTKQVDSTVRSDIISNTPRKVGRGQNG